MISSDEMISDYSSRQDGVDSRIITKSFYSLEHDDELISGRKSHQGVRGVLLNPGLRLAQEELCDRLDDVRRIGIMAGGKFLCTQ